MTTSNCQSPTRQQHTPKKHYSYLGGKICIIRLPEISRSRSDKVSKEVVFFIGARTNRKPQNTQMKAAQREDTTTSCRNQAYTIEQHPLSTSTIRSYSAAFTACAVSCTNANLHNEHFPHINHTQRSRHMPLIAIEMTLGETRNSKKA